MATLENTAPPRRDARAGGVLDDETRQQVAELNLQGIGLLRAALVAAGAAVPEASGAASGGPGCRRGGARRRSGTPGLGPSGRGALAVTLAVPGRGGARLPDAVAWSAADWMALDAAACQRLATCPYLLFALDVAGLLGSAAAPPRAVQDARVPGGEPGVAAPSGIAPFSLAEGRGFARLLFLYAWHLARSSPTIAAFVFGTPLAVLEPLRSLGLARVETLAGAAGSAVRLRWDHEPLIWADWLSAARIDDPAALWASQLRGLQRIAGACRDMAASV